MTVMTHERFKNQYIGTFVEMNGNKEGEHTAANQCVDLALRYAQDVWGIPFNTLPLGNAITWYYHPTKALKDGATRIKNYKDNVPSQGAIIVFSYLKTGHIAIVDKADAHYITLIEQNGGGHASLGEKLDSVERAKDCVRIHTRKYFHGGMNVVGWYELK